MKYKYNILLCHLDCQDKYPMDYCKKYCKVAVSLSLFDEYTKDKLPKHVYESPKETEIFDNYHTEANPYVDYLAIWEATWSGPAPTPTHYIQLERIPNNIFFQ